MASKKKPVKPVLDLDEPIAGLIAVAAEYEEKAAQNEDWANWAQQRKFEARALKFRQAIEVLKKAAGL